jgi:hypothetical protein
VSCMGSYSRSIKFVFLQHDLSNCLECMLGVEPLDFGLVGLPILRHLVCLCLGTAIISRVVDTVLVRATDLYEWETAALGADFRYN